MTGKRQQAPDPNVELVQVMETTRTDLVAAAEAALREAGIDCEVVRRGMSDQILGQRSTDIIGETTAPFAIVVRQPDAPRAFPILAGLLGSPRGSAAAVDAVPARGDADRPAAPASSARPPAPADAAVDLFDKDSGAHVGSLTRAQFDALSGQLERESETDDDYYIDAGTLAMLADTGIDASVIDVLRSALGARDGVEVRWVEKRRS